MRRAALLVLVNAFASIALAQQNAVSIFVTQIDGGFGYGAAFSRQWNPRLSTAISIGAEEPDVTICRGGIFTPQTCTDIPMKTIPIDLTARWHFINDTRWKPYIGGGVRYVAAPDLSAAEKLIVGRDYRNGLDAEAVGGLELRVTPAFAIFTELKGLFRSPEPYDSLLKISGGVSWRF